MCGFCKDAILHKKAPLFVFCCMLSFYTRFGFYFLKTQRVTKRSNEQTKGEVKPMKG